MSRRDIEFDADGVTLRGWFYPAEGVTDQAPVVVMAHGYSAVKEQYLDKYGAAFAAAGFSALVFDNRNFGASGGEPRQEIIPQQQIDDYRHAITYATTLDEVDNERIAVWGSSYSGGHVLVLGAIDRRVKAVVSQGPMVNGPENFRRLVRADFINSFRRDFEADRANRFRGGAPAMVPVVTEDPLGVAALPTPDSWVWFTESGRSIAPSWKNEVTLRSVEALSEYAPVSYIHLIAPTPLLLLPAINDELTPSDLALAAFALAREPKRIEVLPGGHFDIYINGFERSSGLAIEWFQKYLGA